MDNNQQDNQQNIESVEKIEKIEKIEKTEEIEEIDFDELEYINRLEEEKEIAVKKRIGLIAAVVILVAAICFTVSYIIKSHTSPTSSENTDEIKAATEVKKTDSAEAKAETVQSETVLYDIDSDTSYYEILDSGEAYFDYPDGTVGGLYTGRLFSESRYDGYVEIDYKDGSVLVPCENAVEIENANVLAMGVISQITDSYTGYSGCAVSCLYMMNENSDRQTNLDSLNLSDYESMLNYAEENGYADQGSLLTLNGGMTAGQLQTFAADVFNLKLENRYSSEENPSDILKSIIDSGKQAIVLCKQTQGEIQESDGNSHFIIVTGYYTSQGKIYFVYGNSYYDVNISHGNPLNHVSGDLLNKSVSSYFDEPNAILCEVD